MNQDDYRSPWDDGVYGTGPTQPPKSHVSLIALLLIVIIFLSGIVSVLGVLNVKLFRELSRSREQELPIVFDQEPVTETADTEAVLEETVPAVLPESTEAAISFDIQSAPQTVDTPTDGSTCLPLQEIYEQNIPSVVSIISTTARGTATGTGVILSEQGYIVTNHHVIENAGSIEVQLTDERRLEARIVGQDSVSDLAVLKVEADNLVAARFGDSDALRVGDTVVAIGDPLGVEFRGTMTNGIVSAINRDVNVNGRTLNLIQTNAALNSGNSGGPLINCYGQVIGVNTMKIGAFADDAGVEGLGFAIPSATVREIVGQLIGQGYVSGRPWLGISGEMLSPFYQHFYRLPAGLYITEVDEGSPADLAGIEMGDILEALDGESVEDMDTLRRILYGHETGDVVQVIIYRSGQRASANITLGQARE